MVKTKRETGVMIIDFSKCLGASRVLAPAERERKSNTNLSVVKLCQYLVECNPVNIGLTTRAFRG